jgi:hypothetical protein
VFFGVVGCPDCRRVQVVDAGSERVQCRGCQRSFLLAERTKFYSGDDADEARRVAAKVAMQVGGAPIEVIAETAAAMEREHRLSLEDVIGRLEAKPEFGASDVEELLLRSRVTTTAARVVEGLRQANRLYEPRPGRYRWLG